MYMNVFHFHLLFHTLQANLSEFMRHFKDLSRKAMELSCRSSNDKQKEIGAIFGVGYSTVSQNRVRLKNKLKINQKLKKQFDQLLNHIDNLSK